MQNCEIKTNENNEELVQHGDYEFPCAVYFSDIDIYTASEIAWHWHKEIEIVVLYEGNVSLETAKESIILKKGDGVFINSEELHYFKKIGDEKCVLISYVFDKSLVIGDKGSIIERKYIEPLVQNKTLSLFKISEKLSRKLEEVFFEYEDKKFGVEINIRNILSSVLLEIIIENREKLIEKKTYKNLDNQRIKGMLDFIQKNYSNELTLKEIGEAVFIGERETLRCFARTIGISPIEYLKKYRVKVAANLLTTTDLPVTEICIQCGFNSPSYFSKSFQRVFNVTPREYRKNKIVTM
ncbi:helix-turn-helix domain-containing protein [uncultured Fusobacterium sp.]|uniref:AraC family transcriptional regulator n=1 Tax=uncultured Fusobacterium sp. TaxID=159267 RepID=UPI0025D91151|nr:helix-turn-helix domain-containing protein [uncultured Fusobacterium sp.]